MIQRLASLTAQLSHLAGAIGRRLSNSPPTVLIYLNLPQDLDMLLPIALRFKECSYPLQVVISDKAWQQSPRTLLAWN